VRNEARHVASSHEHEGSITLFDRIDRGTAHRGGPHPTHRHHADPDQPRGRGRRGDHGDHGRRGPRGFRVQSRRGLIREAVLTLLAEQPMHGYQLITELGERTGGRWRPSAGSIYPTLQQLEDEGLVSAQEQEGRRVFSLTDAGRAAVAALDPTSRPWARRGDDARDDIRSLARELGIAAIQVMRVGSPAANDAARTVLTEARRDLYRILADDAPTTDEPATHG
jgi:DNA-binding PadR family transcriptional regulator